MQSIIQQVDGWDELTPGAIRSALLEIVETRIAARAGLNDTAWATGARGLRDFGVEAWSTLRGTLSAMGMSAVVDQLNYGMDFGDPQTQAMLDQLGQLAPEQFTAERVATLKAWGVTRETRWANLGGEGDVPSEEEIGAAVLVINATTYGETLAQRVGAAIRLAAAADGATEATIRAAAIAEVG